MATLRFIAVIDVPDDKDMDYAASKSWAATWLESRLPAYAKATAYRNARDAWLDETAKIGCFATSAVTLRA